MLNQSIQITVQIIDYITKAVLYLKDFPLSVRIDFITATEAKKHSVENHLEWVAQKITINERPEVINRKKKWSIYLVNYGMNIGSEINGMRPSIVYKKSQFAFGSDLIVIPLTSYDEEKSIDTFDVLINPDNTNGLSKPSLIKTRQMRCVSQKRLGRYFWKIKDTGLMDSLDRQLTVMLWLQSIKNPSDCSEGHTQSQIEKGDS